MPSPQKSFFENQISLCYTRDYKETGDAKEEKECYSFHSCILLDICENNIFQLATGKMIKASICTHIERDTHIP